jgi:hypothetical protein
MTNLTPEQIKRAVLQGLKEVADRFARDPTPTDGAIRSTVTEAAPRSNGRPQVKTAAKRRQATRALQSRR